MDAKYKKAADLKAGDVFAMRNSEISFLTAKIISVEGKDEVEIEIKYEFEAYGKTHPRRDLLPKNSYVLMME